MESKIACAKADIDLQNATVRYARHGISQGTAQHKVITAKMERIGEPYDDLIKRIGERRAIRFLVKTIDRCERRCARPPLSGAFSCTV